MRCQVLEKVFPEFELESQLPMQEIAKPSNKTTYTRGNTHNLEKQGESMSCSAKGDLEPKYPTRHGASIDFTDLVSRIEASDGNALEQLYQIFGQGVRYYLCRHLGSQDLEDRLHDTLLIVIKAIQAGDLRDPSRLMGFVRTVARRQIAAYIEQRLRRRRDQVDVENVVMALADQKHNPEQETIVRQKQELIQRTLMQLSTRDREILVRFYLREQTQEEICRDMNLTEGQFRLLKTNAKARFGDLGRKSVARLPRCCLVTVRNELKNRQG